MLAGSGTQTIVIYLVRSTNQYRAYWKVFVLHVKQKVHIFSSRFIPPAFLLEANKWWKIHSLFCRGEKIHEKNDKKLPPRWEVNERAFFLLPLVRSKKNCSNKVAGAKSLPKWYIGTQIGNYWISVWLLLSCLWLFESRF